MVMWEVKGVRRGIAAVSISRGHLTIIGEV